MVTGRDFSGHLNLDAYPERVAPADYIDALNISRARQPENVCTNITGNRLVNFNGYQSGTNITLTGKEDKLRNRVIEFSYNSNGYHTILIFNLATRARTKVFQSKTDSGGVDILRFQPLSKIQVDILYRENDGDLIFFNDGVNPPGVFNIDTIGSYAPDISEEIIRLSKKPPLYAPIVTFGSDTSKKYNALRSKIFQFKYRYVYKDGFKSTWSPISKRQLPISGYSVVTDTNPTENNVLNIQVTGASENDFHKIEIAGRESIGEVYSDFFLIESLDKDDYHIAPGQTFTYKFYNNGAYATIDVNESELPFDYVPDLANAQALVNGNVMVYGGITEGYDQLIRSAINVQIGARYSDTSPNPVPGLPPDLGYTLSSSPSISPTDYRMFVIFGPNTPIGSRFHVGFITSPISGNTYSVNVDYIATTTVLADAVSGLRAAIDAALPPIFTVQIQGTDTIKIEVHVSPSIGASVYNNPNVYAVSPSTVQNSAGTWKWNANYRLGLIYFDKNGKTNGVVSPKQIEGDPNNFEITTPDFVVSSANGYAPRVPVLTASVNHLPPDWAETFQWVRTNNLSVSKFLQYTTCQVDQDDNYIYFCIENLDRFKIKNTGFLPSYEFLKGDRVRVMDVINTSATPRYSETYYSDDFEILGIETRPLEGSIDPQATGRFIKVRRPSSSSLAYDNTLLIELYTPAKRNADTQQVFYEFGEVYPIYILDGVRYHGGDIQAQTASEPAKFEFREGDVYLKFRQLFTVTFTDGDIYYLSMMDSNYADYWQSAVSSNGRPWVIEPNAKRTYNPVLRRFGNAFQQGTVINELNRFYPENYDEDVRDFGPIMKMFPWNNSLIVCQKFKIGRVPVLQQIWEDAAGADTVGVSQKLLNRIQYYTGEYGVGDLPESVAYNNSSIWGWDNYRGVNWRISQNGLSPISIIHNINNFAVREAGGRNFNYKVYGVYNSADNEYISAFEPTNVLAAKTLVWDEVSGGYRSFTSYFPEAMCCINNLLIAWKNGQLYTFDSTTYNNFFGVQYESSVTAVFNDNAMIKKSFNDIVVKSGEKWDAPAISTNTKTTNVLYQQSNLVESDFEEKEGQFYSPLFGDLNSITPGDSINNGEKLKGNFIIVKFRKSASGTTGPVFISAAVVGYTESKYNNVQ